jgi:hypothetical protein
MYNDSGAPVLVNVDFIGNQSYAFYQVRGNTTATEVRFIENQNGALFVGGLGDLRITRAVFERNFSDAESAGYIVRIANAGITEIDNAVFKFNTGVAVAIGDPNSLSIRNSTFYGNSSKDRPSISAIAGGGIDPDLFVNVENCIFWDNGEGAGIGGKDVDRIVVSNSLVQGEPPETNDYSYSTFRDGGGNIYGQAPQFETSSVSLKLSSGSPAIDAGSNALVPAELNKDLAGASRIVDGNGDGEAVVDMGAYEKQ